jgi:hypothetical protein
VRHSSDGALRVLVDEPDLLSPAERAHVAGCATCRRRLHEVAARAERVSGLLARESPEPTVDVEAGLQRLRLNLEQPRRRGWPALAAALGTRRRRLQVALAVSLAVTLVTGVAGGWAQNLIVVFRQPTHVVVVPVRPQEANSLLALASYGTLRFSTLPVTHRVADARAAEAEAGFAPLQPGALPAGVPDAPTYLVQPAYTVTFTFDAARARQAGATRGSHQVPMPPDVDGASVSIDVGAVIFAEYGAGSAGPPALATVRMNAPTVRSTGVTIARVQQYLLSLPDVSPALAARIRAIDDPGQTLPLLVLSADGTVQPARVQGGPASMLSGSTRYGTGIAWVRDGFVVAVYGSSAVGDLRAAAEAAG